MTTTKKTTTKTRKPRSFSVKKTVSLDLPRNPFMFEILNLISKQRTKAKKIEVLKKYEELPLKVILIWNFDESVVSVLPPGEVPYTGYDEQNVYTGGVSSKISEEVRSMHETGSFSLGAADQQGIKGGDDGLNNLRRESMFINILEGLHPLEAEIVIACKDKKLGDIYKITKEVIAEAYPDIRWGGRS